MFNIWWYPQQVMVARFTSIQKQSDLHQHHFDRQSVIPFSNQPLHFLPQPAFSMSSLASLSSFELQPQNLMLFLGHDNPLTIPMNTVYHYQLIYCLFQTQHEHHIHRSFPIFELYCTHCCHHGSFSLL